MKLESICLILLFFFASNILHGQYIPIVEEGKFWIYLNHQDEDHPSPVSGHAITFEGDSIINSLRYKKVYILELAGEHSCPYPPCFQFNFPYQTTGKFLISFIREDTVRKKVFMLPDITADLFCDSKEYLIFDYSLNMNDTLNPCIYQFIGAENGENFPWGIVDSINVTYRFGKNRNTIFTTGVMRYGGLPPIGEVLILEGIGLEHYGLFHEPLSYLVDFCEGGMEACEIAVSTHAIDSPKRIALFPNPTDGIVHISVNEGAYREVRVFTILGEFITEFQNTGAIDLSNQENGIYFIEAILENKERIVQKIVKCN